jgi:hypothetical protein
MEHFKIFFFFNMTLRKINKTVSSTKPKFNSLKFIKIVMKRSMILVELISLAQRLPLQSQGHPYTLI